MNALKQWWKSLGESDERFLTKIQFGVNFTSSKRGDPSAEDVFFLLFEDSKGRRSIEINSITVPELAGVRITKKNWSKVMNNHLHIQPVRFLFSTKQWVETVYPWLCGRLIPEIPDYDDVPKHDFKRALKGK